MAKTRWEEPNRIPMGKKHAAVVRKSYPRGYEVLIVERNLATEQDTKERINRQKESRGQPITEIDPSSYIGVGGQTIIRIPSDNKGVIDQNLAIARLMQVGEGDRGGRQG
jgi:hypothetical protein